MIEKAKQYALESHRGTNHLYDGKPYEIHLEMVVNVAKRFIHLIPQEQQENVLSACWLHDVIEDCRQTYNDVKNQTNFEVAEIVYALTNEKGRSRKERANDKYYWGIKTTPYAVFVKLCDRIANYEYSISVGSRMAAMYEKEMELFCDGIYDKTYQPMFDYLLIKL